MTGERYRRLPGRRRGIFGGASVWLGSDHLLAVRSMRFRESYKRFYLRDVQAIAVARRARFHISVRSLAIALPALWTYLILRSLWDWADVVFWSLMLCLGSAWVLVSMAFSCTCRIYTAVSRDELPSIYRIWTARRFLAKVEPLIVQVQGTIEGDWAEAVESKGVGPALPLPPPEFEPANTVQPLLAGKAVEPEPPLQIERMPSYFFIGTLLLDAGFRAATLHTESRAAFWTSWGLTLLRVVAASYIFVQRHRRRVQSGIQKLAIISLAAMGLFYYVQQLSRQLTAASTGAAAFDGVSVADRIPWMAQVDIAISVVLALSGIAMVVRSRS